MLAFLAGKKKMMLSVVDISVLDWANDVIGPSALNVIYKGMSLNADGLLA